jgi:hypothetical protein
MARRSSSMAASASNPVNALPGAGFPSGSRGTVLSGVRGSIRSYDHHGVCFCWQPPPRLSLARAAIDVEEKSNPSDSYLGARFGLPSDAFLRRWTATEALAKVLDQPVLDFIKKQGLLLEARCCWTHHPLGPWLLRIDHPTHWVTVAAIL